MSPPVYMKQWQTRLRPALILTIQETPKGFTWVLTPRCGASKNGLEPSFMEAEASALLAADSM